MTKAAELAKMGEVLTNSQIGGRRNIVINGAMQVAQRGTSQSGITASANEGYTTVDRFAFDGGTHGGVFTASQSTDAPTGFSNSLKMDCTTADTSIAAGEYLMLQTRFEGQDVQQLKKGTSSAEKVTVSFYVKGNASATYMCELQDNDNARTNGQTFAVTTDWTRVILTFVGDTTGTLDNDNNLSLRLNFFFHSGSTFNGGTFTSNQWTATTNERVGSITSFFDSTDREFFITGIQLELGSQATPFEHRSFGEELALCQRYYFQKINGNSQPVGIGTYISSGQIRTYIDFPVEMRADPSIVTSSGTSHFNIENPSDDFDGGWVLVQVNKTSAIPYATGSVSGTTSYSGVIRSKSADSRLAFEAEL
jgi:hypothetical protein